MILSGYPEKWRALDRLNIPSALQAQWVERLQKRIGSEQRTHASYLKWLRTYWISPDSSQSDMLLPSFTNATHVNRCLIMPGDRESKLNTACQYGDMEGASQPLNIRRTYENQSRESTKNVIQESCVDFATA